MATCDLLAFDSIRGLDVYNQPAVTESDGDDDTEEKKTKIRDAAKVLVF